MAETIEIKYRRLGPGYYHKYIIYTDSAGKQFVANGKPSNDMAGTYSELVQAQKSQFNGEVINPFGYIVAKYGEYTPTSMDWDHENDDPSELVEFGADLSSSWRKITAAIEQIDNELHEYRPLNNNSNSVADEALRRAGLSEPIMDDITGFNNHWAPGSGIRLPSGFDDNIGCGFQPATLSAENGGMYLKTGENEFSCILPDLRTVVINMGSGIGTVIEPNGNVTYFKFDQLKGFSPNFIDSQEIKKTLEEAWKSFNSVIEGIRNGVQSGVTCSDRPGGIPPIGNGDGGTGGVQPFGDAPNMPRLPLPGQGAGWDPLILDLDGDGLELTDVTTSRAYFDMDGDDFAERVGWVAGDDGLLVRDLDGNGRIDQMGELFGDQTTSGFAVLSTLDGNGDGLVDANDAGFSDLRVWRDANQNGVSENGELHDLASLGISSFALASTASNLNIANNAVTEVGSYTRSDGFQGVMGDAHLQSHQVDTKFIGSVDLDVETLFLPKLRGYGQVADLHLAMSLDPQLKSLVKEFSELNMGQSDQFNARMDEILWRWAGTDNIDPRSRGGVFDARRLTTLERFYALPFTQEENPNPDLNAVGELSLAWSRFRDIYLSRLVVQGPAAGLFQNAQVNLYADSVSLGEPVTVFAERLSSYLPEGTDEAHLLLNNMSKYFDVTGQPLQQVKDTVATLRGIPFVGAPPKNPILCEGLHFGDVVDGNDGIEAVTLDGRRFSGGTQVGEGQYSDARTGITSTINGNTLTISVGGNTAVIVNFNPDNMHVQFTDEACKVQNYVFDAFKNRIDSYLNGSPLVLDMDGDGLELTDVAHDPVMFNLLGDDFTRRVGWVRGDDALLVRDLNGNGQIDDIHELFGDETTLNKEQLQQIPIGAPDPADPYRDAPGFGKLAA